MPIRTRGGPLTAPKAHQAQQQTNDRGDAHDPAAGSGRFIHLHQIGGAGENAEDHPRQRMWPRLAAQRLPDVDAVGDQRDDDGKRPHRVLEGDRKAHLWNALIPASPISTSSCPHLLRASTTWCAPQRKTWMAGTSPAMTERDVQ